MRIIKRDGRIEEFDERKVYNAVLGASKRTEATEYWQEEIAKNASEFIMKNFAYIGNISVDDVHDKVERYLMEYYPNTAKEYIVYRQHRTDIRESRSSIMDSIEAISKEMHKDNANTNNSAASKMHGIAETANKAYVISKLLKPIHAENHKKGIVYINDLSYYQHTFNCFFNPIGQMLKQGFDNGVGSIRSPKRVGSAMAQCAIILQSSQNSMYGGQGIVNFDGDLATYVQAEYEYWETHWFCYVDCGDGDTPYDYAMEMTEKAVYKASQAFVYNMNTMRSRSGAQVTFSSINFGTDTTWQGRMVSRNILLAYIAGLGNGENPIFPNLCFRVKSGVNKEVGTPNYDIYRLALDCVGHRIQPRFVFADASFNKDSWETSATMGCRTAVRSDVNGDGNPDARGNLAFNNISLPYIALEVNNDIPWTSNEHLHKTFMDRLDEVCDQAIDQLYERYKVIKALKVRDVPFVAQWYQGHDGLSDDDTVEPMVKHGSLSMGFIGLAECLTALFGKHHGESEDAQRFGLEIVEFMRRKTDEATEKYGLNFSTFATPSESACYTLLKLCKQRFGEVVGVTDKEYFTNSSHLPVGFRCTMQHKIDTEAPYHKYCNAGHIMYVEMLCSPKNNTDAVELIVNYMAEQDVAYGGVNWVHSFCDDCKYQGDFKEECPKCHSENIKVTAIITGYLSERQRFNKGKVAELNDRVAHGGVR